MSNKSNKVARSIQSHSQDELERDPLLPCSGSEAVDTSVEFLGLTLNAVFHKP